MIVFIIVVSAIIAVGSLTLALLNLGSLYDEDMGIDAEDQEKENE